MLGMWNQRRTSPGKQTYHSEKNAKETNGRSAGRQGLFGQQKEKYGKNMEDKLAEFNKKISELKEKAAASSGEAKAKMDEQIKNLSKESDSVKEKLGKVK